MGAGEGWLVHGALLLHFGVIRGSAQLSERLCWRQQQWESFDEVAGSNSFVKQHQIRCLILVHWLRGGDGDHWPLQAPERVAWPHGNNFLIITPQAGKNGSGRFY